MTRKQAEVLDSLRLFPQGDSEFDGIEDLAVFLEGELKARGGVYRVKRASKYTGLRPGYLVVFHKNRRFVGEGRVAKKLWRYPRQRLIKGQKYEGQVVFDPESIRVYAPSFDAIHAQTGLNVNKQAIQRISIKDYRAIVGLR